MLHNTEISNKLSTPFKILGTQIGTGREGTAGYVALPNGDAPQEKRLKTGRRITEEYERARLQTH